MKKKLFLLPWIFYASLSFGNEITLDYFLQKVKEQNLNLKLETAKQNASEEKAGGIRLPPPMFSFIQAKEDSGNSPSGFEVNQEVPFPTKLKANRSSRIYEAEAQKAMLSANQNEILAKAKLSYIELWLMQERVEVIQQKKRILEEHIRLSRSAVRSDSFLKIHLLKAESDLDLLENELESSKQTLKEKQLILADIINEDHQTFNPTAAEPPMSTIPEINEGDNIPQLKSLRLGLEGMKERESEAKSSWLPDFNLKYKQMGATSMSSRYNEVMIGITLPFIYFWQPNADAKTANIETLQAELNLKREERNIDTRVATLYSKVESLQKQLSNLKSKLIPRAHQRMKIVRNLAPRDMETIQDHRETMEAFPELRMTELELRMQYEESIAELEKYVANKGQSHE
ncbi:TolC family protein [Bacteriovorax stolpii]|uniref:TolC family protein n=1 Tax=Bacteriovorax stolpii TaxID=960 RepID=UPI00163BD362|nr:TolC family protein [Bacteriovorax stolpii]